MNKEECNRAIEVIDDYVNGSALKENPTKYEANKAIELIDKLIIEHFDNQPLKFKDLTHYMWVWDNKIARYYHAVCYTDDFGIKKICLDGERLTSGTEREWEDGRYYAREVKE